MASLSTLSSSLLGLERLLKWVQTLGLIAGLARTYQLLSQKAGLSPWQLGLSSLHAESYW